MQEIVNAHTIPTNIRPLRARQTFLIPIANPNTATQLLHLAEKFLWHRGGRVILLFVVTERRETAAAKIAMLQSVVDSAYQADRSFSVDFITYAADNVVEGILSAAKQYQANMILLGLSYSIRGQVELGEIVEKVAERAECDVGVYRSPVHPYIERVVVPVGGSMASRVILEKGIQLSESYGLPCEALHVFSSGPKREARMHVKKLLTSVPGSSNVRVNVVHGVDESSSVLSWTDDRDLMVIGFSKRNPLEKWLYGDTAQRILDRARGPVLVVSRAIDNTEIQALARRRLSWLRPRLTEVEQEHIVWLAKDTVLPTLDYFVLLVVAALLASLGLLLNSSAVVIGAMLVAPLMQPIIAMGIALCTARMKVVRQAAVTIVLSVNVALAVGFFSGLLIPPDSPTKEMLARAYPSLLDAGVAIASGFIGAYATARKDIPAALAGVAIAAALVPPICTVGLSLALLEPRLALGAALLFLTNLICITVIAAVVFFWLGMRPLRLESSRRRLHYQMLLVGIITMMLVVGSLLNYTHQPSVERVSELRLRTVLEPAELIGLEIQQQDPLLVVATVRTVTDLAPDTVKMAQVLLSEDLDKAVRLRIIVQKVIEGGYDETLP